MNAAPPRNLADNELAARITAGAIDLALALDAAQVATLVAYLRLIERWNETYNLTSIRDPNAIVTHHILDSLAATAALQRRRALEARRRLVDVGSGAGLPGVVIGIALPETEVVCIDSVGKKAAFITHVAGSLGLRNVGAVHARVERVANPRFDVVASRAFASLAAFVAGTRHLLAENGEWMAVKGRPPGGEIKTLPNDAAVEVELLEVPDLEAERCIVWIQPR